MISDEYHAPESLEEAWHVLAQRSEEAVIIGGGTWVVPALQRSREPVALVSLRRLGLNGVTIGADSVSIGATTTYAELLDEPGLESALPMLHDMCRGVTGGPQIHHQGTIGGSAVAGRPQSDVPGVLVALEATLILSSRSGERSVAAAQFFIGPEEVDRAPGEVVTRIDIPRRARTSHGYVKVKGSTSSWPIVTSGAAVEVTDGRISRVSVGLAAATPTPQRFDLTDLFEGTESRPGDLIGHLPTVPIPDGTSWWSDELAPAWYRAAVAPVAMTRALAGALARAHKGDQL